MILIKFSIFDQNFRFYEFHLWFHKIVGNLQKLKKISESNLNINTSLNIFSCHKCADIVYNDEYTSVDT